MAKTGKTIATLLIGTAIGAALGYLMATDKDKRKEDMTRVKDRFNDLKEKIAKKAEDLEHLEHDIYNG